ncbi:AMP nucleosidase [Corynebacterium sp. HMSC04H06]|uniref:AMP nucleosidase n=1 Tax=Corynebacterium sp. HMSC04H06 TaxID=1581050 RepID=UPI0008A12ED7|nr:AMP nucleosidase [Corynebacterium sp. HMSC04H06]OFS22248.1 AMP nucleosidase [Corynebacterium sp. HMSC04H06]
MRNQVETVQVQTVDEAVTRLIELYEQSCRRSHDFEDYDQVRYPKITVAVREWHPIDRSQPFGYVNEAGNYSAVISKPYLLRDYLTTQLQRLVDNYPCDIYVGYSDVRIPPEYIRGAPPASQDRGTTVPRPTLDDVNDAIIDGDWDAFHGAEKPLFHFGPQRFDIACERIEHYTGIEVDTVQKYILFTNYAMHTTEFVQFGLRELASEDSRYTALVLPTGETIHPNDAVDLDVDELTLTSRYQMPRFDLITAAGDGITMINIGVGPSNAKTITDCLAVLRPEAWIMIGHCAGLDGRMRIGDLILGNAYQRDDGLLDEPVTPANPIPAIPEIQRMLEASVDEIYGADNPIMRTGTVLSTNDRNWEWRTTRQLWEWLRASAAVAVDMESCTLAANGYRYRVPYGTLLAVSDLPLHAVPKLPAQAQAFYSNSKQAHVMCAVRAVEQLAENPSRLHTRKLRRALGEVPFR